MTQSRVLIIVSYWKIMYIFAIIEQKMVLFDYSACLDAFSCKVLRDFV